MPDLRSIFGDTAPDFDNYDAVVPDHIPDPGPFLEGHELLTGRRHAAFHRLSAGLFEQRGVYDATFGYNLARLNLDPRHPDAGFRYAVDADNPGTLWAEFTPTTAFCPQGRSLVTGAFRAWNGLAHRHEYDVVEVRVGTGHHDAETINAELEALAERFRETGELGSPPEGDQIVPPAESGERIVPETAFETESDADAPW